MPNIISSLTFKGYKIKEINFKSVDNEPGIKNFKLNPKLGFSVKKFDKGFDVIITANIEKEEDYPIPFELKVSIIGRFLCSNVDFGIDRLIPKAAEILFPYLRSTISTITLNSNIPPYILPTLDVNKVFEKAKAKQQKPNNEGTVITKVFSDEEKNSK